MVFFSNSLIMAAIGSKNVTVLRREEDDTVTVVSLERSWTPDTSRNEEDKVVITELGLPG